MSRRTAELILDVLRIKCCLIASSPRSRVVRVFVCSSLNVKSIRINVLY